jgi:hypothetical protein
MEVIRVVAALALGREPASRTRKYLKPRAVDDLDVSQGNVRSTTPNAHFVAQSDEHPCRVDRYWGPTLGGTTRPP